MKKFFKALALVLALTLVVGTIPASAAELDFSLKKEKKIIYLGGASGEKEVDGETIKCGTKSRYKVSKLVNGFDPETMDIQLESSDKSIVKTSNAKDKVYAKAIGTADVTIYVIDKETEKQLKDLTLKVQVKKNAAAVTAVITDAEGNPADLTASKAGVNVPYIVTLPRKDADGNFVDTDYRTLTASDESVQIEAANKYGTQYKVTFTKAGTFALTAASYQSKIWNKLQNVVTVPVTAGYDAVAVEQSALDTVKVTFDTPVTGLEKANFNAYYKINDVVIPYSDVDSISYDANDKNVAYVKFLSDFIANTEFTVQYDKKDVGTFKAIAVSVESVKTVLIPVQKVEAGVEADLQYKLLGENDIDVTTGVLAAGGIVSFEIVNDDFKNYVTNEKVYISNAGDSITIKGTYTYWDKDNNQKTVTGEGQVYAVAPEEWKIGSVTGIVTDGSKALIKDDGSVDGDVKAINYTMDYPYAGALQIAVPFTKGNKTVNEGFNKDVDGPNAYVKYTAKVADETILLLDNVDGQNQWLIANKPGTTTVLIYGVTGDGKEVVIGAVPVTVKAVRTIGSWTISSSKTNINLDFDDDAVTYEIVVKDQDGQTYTKAVTVTVEDKSTNTALKLTGYDVQGDAANGKVKVTVKTTDLEGAGTHNLAFTVKDGGDAKTVRLVAGEDGPATRYLLKVTANELKVGIATDTKNAGAEIKLEGLSKTGSAAAVASGVALQFTGVQPKATAKADYENAGGVTGYVYTVTKDGKLLDKAPAGLLVANVLSAFDGTKTASDAAVKLDKGTYVINAYNIELNKAGTSYVPNPVGSAQTINVIDDQAAFAAKKNSNAEKLTDVTSFDEVVGAFDITFGGKNINEISGIEVVDIVGNVDDALTTRYINKFVVRVTSPLGYKDFDVNVDTLVRKGN